MYAKLFVIVACLFVLCNESLCRNHSVASRTSNYSSNSARSAGHLTSHSQLSQKTDHEVVGCDTNVYGEADGNIFCDNCTDSDKHQCQCPENAPNLQLNGARTQGTCVGKCPEGYFWNIGTAPAKPNTCIKFSTCPAYPKDLVCPALGNLTCISQTDCDSLASVSAEEINESNKSTPAAAAA